MLSVGVIGDVPHVTLFIMKGNRITSGTSLIHLIGENNMAEEKKELWLNYLALTTVILAVGATLATFKGGQYSTRSVLSQSQASDQWTFFHLKA
jgi:hypothetical protein